MTLEQLKLKSAKKMVGKDYKKLLEQLQFQETHQANLNQIFAKDYKNPVRIIFLGTTARSLDKHFTG